VSLLWWWACTPKVPVEPMPVPAPQPVEIVREGGPWQTTVYADHPLVGRIWSMSRSEYVTQDEVVSDLRAVAFVLLGEKHDNPDHHRLQGGLVQALAPAAVAFEMLDHTDPVEQGTDPASLAAAVKWADSGWPPFEVYEPVFAATYTVGADVIAAHPTREEVRQAMNSGLESLPATATAGLQLDKPLQEAHRAELAAEIVASHCGHAPQEMQDMMIRAQILKDAWMARAMGQARQSRPGTVVLIAGGGHTRRDRGVPHYLADSARTVLLTEVVAGQEDPAAYDEGADYLWFTPRVDDVDPCEKYREQLHQMSTPAPEPK
jgi:uncharacterized iron-regulated protein